MPANAFILPPDSRPKTPKEHTSVQELTLSKALSDPLIRSLMAADKVDPTKLEAMLTKIAREVALNAPSAVRGCACIA
jgi:hypothetical protein